MSVVEVLQPPWLLARRGRRRWRRSSLSEIASGRTPSKWTYKAHRLLIADLARLQAILIAGRAPQGPIGLLKSVGQHRELAAVAQRAGGTARTLAVETVVLGLLPFLWVLVMGEGAFHLGQRTMVLVCTDSFFAHQRLFLGLLFLLQHFPHEISLVHWSSNDFQVIRVDDYLSKIYNRWGLALCPLPLIKGSCGSFHFLLFDACWVPVSHSGLSVSEHQKIKMVVPLEGSISISSNSRRGSVTQKFFSYKRLVFQNS